MLRIDTLGASKLVNQLSNQSMNFGTTGVRKWGSGYDIPVPLIETLPIASGTVQNWTFFGLAFSIDSASPGCCLKYLSSCPPLARHPLGSTR